MIAGAWLITAGTNSGVVKLVGDAKHDYELAHGAESGVVLLGITPWGLVKNRDILKNDYVSFSLNSDLLIHFLLVETT